MSITHLLFQTCKVARVTETRGNDGDVVSTEEIVAANLPCRLDKGMSTVYANMLRGNMRAEQVAGTLYIDGDALDDTNAPLDIKSNDRITLDGQEYEIFFLNRTPGLNKLQHWELGVLNTENA